MSELDVNEDEYTDLEPEGCHCDCDGTDHPQVTATYPNGVTVDVDVRLQTVLESLWRGGVNTLYSCEGDPRMFKFLRPRFRHLGYILFVDSPEVQEWLSRVRELADAEFYEYESADEDDFIPTKVVRGKMWGVESDEFFGYRRVCLRFPETAIPMLEQVALELCG